jgi:hypothetical protein
LVFWSRIFQISAEHVHVHKGGQAIVGTVQAGGGGNGDSGPAENCRPEDLSARLATCPREGSSEEPRGCTSGI